MHSNPRHRNLRASDHTQPERLSPVKQPLNLLPIKYLLCFCFSLWKPPLTLVGGGLLTTSGLALPDSHRSMYAQNKLLKILHVPPFTFQQTLNELCPSACPQHWSPWTTFPSNRAAQAKTLCSAGHREGGCRPFALWPVVSIRPLLGLPGSLREQRQLFTPRAFPFMGCFSHSQGNPRPQCAMVEAGFGDPVHLLAHEWPYQVLYPLWAVFLSGKWGEPLWTRQWQWGWKGGCREGKSGNRSKVWWIWILLHEPRSKGNITS